jgi:hypothetical protein
VDVLEDSGERRPGGGAFYSALQAARLGLRALIITQGHVAELEELLAPYRGEVELRIFPAQHTTTLATSGMGAGRRQRMLAWAGAIAEPLQVDTEILHLAAVARETPADWRGNASFVGVTPQGLMRSWHTGGVTIGQADGEGIARDGTTRLVKLDAQLLPGRIDAVVVSEQEHQFCGDAFDGVHDRHDRRCTVAVTAAGTPTQLQLPDGKSEYARTLTVAQPRDDLGAGDVFAATFFIALSEGRAAVDAALRGNTAAALRIAGSGPRAVADLAAIERAQQR